MTEKRRFERFSTVLDTRYTKSQGHATISSLSRTRDISLYGLCLTLSRTVNVKDTILIEIRFMDKIKIATLVKVVWRRPDPSNGHNICGLKFLWISSKSILNDSIVYAESASDIT